jgi:prepilin-type N-terminal cleavage/methylation domain-containing protein
MRPSVHFTKQSTGFTLIELLVVIAIIAVLAALAFPSVSRMLTSGSAAKITSNLRQTGAALSTYIGDNNMRMPATGTTSSGEAVSYGLQPSTHSWFRIIAENHKGSGAYNDPGTRLAAHLARYAGVTGSAGTETKLDILSDPLWASEVRKNGGPTDAYWMQPPFVLRPQIARSRNPGLAVDLYPFGRDGQQSSSLKPADTYTKISSSIPASRTWAVIQSDRELIKESGGMLTSGMVGEKAPAKPVLGTHRIALMFDWSVQRIPAGTDLRGPYAAK